MADIRFEIATPLGFSVRTTHTYWQKLIIKHPDIASLEDLVQQALQAPMRFARAVEMRESCCFIACIDLSAGWLPLLGA